MKIRATLASLSVVALALTACSDDGGSADQAEGDGSVDFVTIAAGGTSGPYYQIGASMSQVLADALGADSSVQASGASVENIELLTSGRAEVAFVMGDATRQALEGTGPFEGKEALSELQAITALYPNYVQIITTAGSGIESVSDLEGRSVGVGDQNSGVELNAQMILEAHDMSYDDIDEDFLSYADAIDQMKNGQIEAAFVTSGLPNSSVMDLATTEDVIVVPVEGEGMDALQEQYPFFDAEVIPGGTYDQDEDVQTAAITNQLLVSPDLSEDQVYEITKAIFENIETIQNSHNAAKLITLDSVEEGLATDLHPGAVRYFDEVNGS